MIKRSTYPGAIILLMLPIMLTPVTPCAQPDLESDDTDSLVDLKIIVEIDSIPENLLALSMDSTILISLFRGQYTNNRPYAQKVCTLEYNESQTARMVSFDSIPLASYTIEFYFAKYDHVYSQTKDLLDSTEFRFNLTPHFYTVMFYANPQKYKAHCTYRKIKKIKNDSYYFGDSNPANGIIEISLLERKICRVILEMCEPEIDFTEVLDFSCNSFRGRYTKGIPLADRSARPFIEVIISPTDK
ncbi:MAG: hypothetical protein V3V99_15205 [candidate division Zixibacteria bacterium]